MDPVYYSEIVFQPISKSKQFRHLELQQTLERSSDDALVVLSDDIEIPQTMIDQVVSELGDQEWDLCYLDFDKPESKARICRDRDFVIDNKDHAEMLAIGSSPVLISPLGQRKLLSAIGKKKKIRDKINTNKIKVYSKGCSSKEIHREEHLGHFWFFLAIALTVLVLAIFYSLSPEASSREANGNIKRNCKKKDK